MTEFEQLNKKFPFLTCGTYAGQDVIGIVQNTDEKIIAIYIYDAISTIDMKKKFIEMGETWWWESNRKIPINMFIGEEFKIFAPFIKTFMLKEYQYIGGPKVCIDNLMSKRVKRRSIQLMRKIK